jgi:hypothetical protein
MRPALRKFNLHESHFVYFVAIRCSIFLASQENKKNDQRHASGFNPDFGHFEGPPFPQRSDEGLLGVRQLAAALFPKKSLLNE